MSFPVALLLSLALHTAMIVAPIWLAPKPLPPVASIEARLIPLPAPAAMAEALDTETSASAAQPPGAPSRALQGNSLRRAQAAFSEHLLYPPEAVKRGLEGEVILLLTLTETGQLASAEIARSSGHVLLDQAALDAAGRIGALPGHSRQTLFPVSFRLR